MAIPSGVVNLCKNALVERNYQHTIDFKDLNEQLAYWGSLVKYNVSDFSYIRRSNQGIKVPYTLDQLKDVNYLYFRAEENNKTYFCFVTSKEYTNDNMTIIYFVTDVLQTYMFDYEIKQSYVLQEHCNRWDQDHKPIYSRTDEGLEYGSEYTTEAGYRVKANNDIEWFLAVCTEHKDQVNEGQTGEEPTTINRVANPYIYYLLPSGELTKKYTLKYRGSSDANGHSVGTVTNFMRLMTDYGMGPFVKQIVRLPYLPFNFSIGNDVIDTTPEEGALFGYTGLKSWGAGDTYVSEPYIKIIYIQDYFNFTKKLAEMSIFEGIESALPTAEQWAELLANPYNTERDKRFESKLLTYPYRYNLLTDWKGNPVVIKNEYIGSDKITLNYTQSISFNSPARYWLEGYKKDLEGRNNSLTQLIQEDIPVVSDAYYSYMLQNKNQIEANRTNAVISTVNSVAQNAVGGAIFGGVGGAIGSAATGLLNGAVNYQNMIRSENGKQNDIKNLPDTIVNSNDCSFNMFDNNKFVTFYRYKICCEFEELLADTFNMTGYKVKRVKVPNTRSRLRFNYIKTIGANIVGSFDQEDLSLIKAIYDNGVTIWHYNTTNFKMYDYSLENIERNLLKG